MTATVIVGMQFGDEGKGKAVDIFSEQADYTVRFNGGDNSGHTIVRSGETFKLHLVPSGVLRPYGPVCIIASGVMVNPDVLLAELKMLEDAHIDTSRVFVSKDAHVVMPYHIKQDVEQENSRSAIGTTKRGMGPVYADKSLRTGLRMGDLAEPWNATGSRVGTAHDSEIAIKCLDWHDKLKGRIVDTTRMLMDTQARIVMEGSQGHFLDIDYGTYPYVTSSHTTSAAACLGTGLGVKDITHVVGVMKAYTTRVGAGPFPTEITDEGTAKYITDVGSEYGTTTGRKRRVGWLDLASLADVTRINSIDDIMITKLDVLSGLEEIWVSIGTNNDKPIMMSVPGWTEDISEIRLYHELPANTKAFINLVEKYAEAKVYIVSVGPDRTETIYKHDKSY